MASLPIIYPLRNTGLSLDGMSRYFDFQLVQFGLCKLIISLQRWIVQGYRSAIRYVRWVLCWKNVYIMQMISIMYTALCFVQRGHMTRTAILPLSLSFVHTCICIAKSFQWTIPFQSSISLRGLIVRDNLTSRWRPFCWPRAISGSALIGTRSSVEIGLSFTRYPVSR